MQRHVSLKTTTASAGEGSATAEALASFAIRPLTVAVVQVLCVLVLGTFSLALIEGWDPVTGLYYCAVQLFTIGYGDVKPVTNAGIGFACFFALFGIGFVGNLVSILGNFNVAVMNAIEKRVRSAVQRRQMAGGNGWIYRVDTSNILDVIIATLISAFYLGIGVGIFVPLEGWTPFQGLYFCAITLTTVGYGDFAPKSTPGRLMLVLYGFLGLGVVTFTASLLGNRFTALLRNRIVRLQVLFGLEGDRALPHALLDVIIAATGEVLVFILGSIAFSVIEGWDGLDACYFTVVTMLTIGYGDIYPKTTAGRSFCIVFVFMSLASLSAVLKSVLAWSKSTVEASIARLEIIRHQRALGRSVARDSLGRDLELIKMIADRAAAEREDEDAFQQELKQRALDPAPLLPTPLSGPPATPAERAEAQKRLAATQFAAAYTFAREDLYHRLAVIGRTAKFSDKSFPPTYHSLTGLRSASRAPIDPATGTVRRNYACGYQWLRASELCKEVSGRVRVFPTPTGPVPPGGPYPPLQPSHLRYSHLCAPHHGLFSALAVLSAAGAGQIPNVVTDYKDRGIYAVMLYVQGAWTHVVIDDYLPVDPTGQLEYAGVAEPGVCNGFLACLLEKAWAKHCGSYHRMAQYGSLPELLVALTGASPFFELDLDAFNGDPDRRAGLSSLFRRVAEAVELHPYMVALSSERSLVWRRSVDNGVLQDAAYTVVGSRERRDPATGAVVQELLVRDPWRHSLLCTSPGEGRRHLEVVGDPASIDTRAVWLNVQSLPELFTRVDLFRFFGDAYACSSVTGRWRNVQNIEDNPQYFLTVSSPGRVFIVLTQNVGPGSGLEPGGRERRGIATANAAAAKEAAAKEAIEAGPGRNRGQHHNHNHNHNHNNHNHNHNNNHHHINNNHNLHQKHAFAGSAAASVHPGASGVIMPILVTVANKRGKRLKNMYEHERIVTSDSVAERCVMASVVLVPLENERPYTVVPSTEKYRDGEFLLSVYSRDTDVSLELIQPEIPAD